MSFAMNVSKLVNDSMNQRKLAKAVGIPQSTLSRWLSGKTLPDLYSALKIADALGVRVEVLAGEDRINPERDLLETKIASLGVREVLRRVLAFDDPPEAGRVVASQELPPTSTLHRDPPRKHERAKPSNTPGRVE